MLFRERWILLLATGLGVGKSPVAPGTFGSLLGLVLLWGVAGWPGSLLALFVVGFCMLAVWVSHRAEQIMGTHDPGCIVIDEMAGILIAGAGLPFTVPFAAVVFVLFRMLDILKPFPVGWLDRHLKGGIGIVMDDVAAGILANLAIRLGNLLLT
jgi:phosphatidylglycerophosphatase A